MYATDARTADLTDNVLDTVAAYPRLTARRIAKRLRADAGQVRQALAFLAKSHYVRLVNDGGRDVYEAQ